MMPDHSSMVCGPHGYCDYHAAEAWGQHAIRSIAEGEVDQWMDLHAYQCARIAGRHGNRWLDNPKRAEGH